MNPRILIDVERGVATVEAMDGDVDVFIHDRDCQPPRLIHSVVRKITRAEFTVELQRRKEMGNE